MSPSTHQTKEKLTCRSEGRKAKPRKCSNTTRASDHPNDWSIEMAEKKSMRSRAGFTLQPRLTMGEMTRIAEMAYRYAAWLNWEAETNQQFAYSVLGIFEALLADHAELAGYPIRGPGFGTVAGEEAAQVPTMYRPGFRWPGRKTPRP